MQFKKSTILIATAALIGFSNISLAANDIQEHSIKAALDYGYKNGVIDKSVKLHFKGQGNRPAGAVVGTYTSNKKTNGLNKSDVDACNWAFLSAVKAFVSRAHQNHASAVVDIYSNYQNKPFSSPTKFKCGVGTFVVGVALGGKVVK